jgi:hypothetical protein
MWPAGAYPAGSARRGAPASSRPKRDPGGLVAGLVVAGMGLYFLAGELEPDIGRYIVLVVGLLLLAVFVVRPEYSVLVPGAILTGVGFGLAVAPEVDDTAAAGIMELAIAGAFLAIWLLGAIYRLPQNHWWPLIPGGILTLAGLERFGRAEVGGSIGWWPIVLVVLGALIIGRALGRRR